MQKRTILWTCGVLLGLAVMSSTGKAQPNPFRNRLGQYDRGPSVSPYLNLRRGGPAVFNYYNLVQPQFAAQRSIQRLGAQVDLQGEQLQQQAFTIGADPTIRQTGLRPRFFNYSHYYRFRQTTGGAAGAGGGGQ